MSTKARTPERVDFEAAKAVADLRALIVADCGNPGRGGRWLCPFHADHDPDLAILGDGRNWRCYACGEHGDAIDWLVKQRGITNVEAARELLGAAGDRPADEARAKDDSPAWRN